MRSLLLLSLLLCAVPAAAQTLATIQIQVRSDDGPLPGATVIVGDATHETGPDGRVALDLPPGRVLIAVAHEGFAAATTTVIGTAGSTQEVVVELEPLPDVEETIVVSATRTGALLEDQPLRVEVLAREEIEEKMLMTPGDIVMMLNEMGGMRVQTTSPGIGAASVRIQGMQGRYTRFLSDGLPLFGEVGGIGLLQIPPMDLGQVEVIKGVASSLYGAGAMGGVVNLISRRPGAEARRELLVNRSSRGATDAVAWIAAPGGPGWSWTLLAGGHWQDIADVDEDGWADLSGYSRGVVRPRLFWDDGEGRTFFATVGFTAEDREGGTLPGRAPATTGPYIEALRTRRADAGMVGQMLLGGRYLLSARAATAGQRHEHRFGSVRERDRHRTTFGELTLRAAAGRHTLVAGVAVERDAYRPADVPRFAYTFTVPGAFAQGDLELARWLSVSASGRVDRHSEYGTFFSPRLALLVRAAGWSGRLSAGTGFLGPTPLNEDTEAAGLTRLSIPRPLRAEEGRTLSLDVGRTDGPLSYTVTFFASRIDHPIDVDRSAGLVLTNLASPVTNTGVELLGTWRAGPYAATGTYTYVRSREQDEGVRRESALTPRHSAGIVGMWEEEDAGRIGIELYYTGAQRLEENPYRDRSEPYVVLGVLAERRIGRLRLFVNGENLTGVRQTRWDPLLRPTRAPDGRWTVDAWAPLDGRTINGGVRVEL